MRLLKKILVLLGFKFIRNNASHFKRKLNFRSQFKVFRKTHGERFRVLEKDKYPCLNDATGSTGFDKHYVYHTAWAARKVSEIQPNLHIDISSYLYFSTIVSAFLPVKFYDYRPAELGLSNLVSEHADLTQLPFETNSISSLSCMHVVEHIGLGRYGDPLDVDGDLKSVSELKRVIKKGGDLLFVVPIGGVAKIMFNAHRIYTYKQVLSYFSDFELIEFSLIPDQSSQGIIENATQEQSDAQNYGCGCFWFKKRN